MELELTRRERAVQITLEQEAFLCRCAHAGGVAFEGATTALLRRIHCRIGMSEERLGRAAVSGVEGDADAGGRVHVDAQQPQRRPQCLNGPRGHFLGLLA